MEAGPDRRFKIGELARATGLTVRTLHHCDGIGLLRASDRTDAGYRLYTPCDVGRLYQVAELRKLGFSLAAVGGLLQEGADPRRAVRLQLE